MMDELEDLLKCNPLDLFQTQRWNRNFNLKYITYLNEGAKIIFVTEALTMVGSAK